MLTTLEEWEARNELSKVLEQTEYLMKAIEYAILSTDSGDNKKVYDEIYCDVIEARTYLRIAQSNLEDMAATAIQYLGQ